jgi:hypothetical protein
VVEYGQGPRSGARDNGLRCTGYVAVGDVDPRVADALLETLRTEGIAAYVTPTPAAQGGYLELRLPAQPSDRLYADSTRVERAGELLAAESEPAPAAATPEIDFESAWQQVLGSLQSTAASAPVPPWPASEEIDSRTSQVPVSLPIGSTNPVGDDAVMTNDPALEDHFVPPPPPPLPKLRRTTVMALTAIFGGLVVLATGFDGGGFAWLAILAILGGGARLVWQVKEGPPTDSGWDDGAVV